MFIVVNKFVQTQFSVKTNLPSNLYNELDFEVFKYAVIFSSGWYIRLRHLYIVKWKYLVDQYNNVMMLKHSSREAGAISHNILMNNLCLDILYNGMWSEKDLKFLVLDRGFLTAFNNDFKGGGVPAASLYDGQSYEKIKKAHVEVAKWLDEKHEYQNDSKQIGPSYK